MTDKDRDKLARWEAGRATYNRARPLPVRAVGLRLGLDDAEAFDHAAFCRAYARGLRVVREAEANQIDQIR